MCWPYGMYPPIQDCLVARKPIPVIRTQDEQYRLQLSLDPFDPYGINQSAVSVRGQVNVGGCFHCHFCMAPIVLITQSGPSLRSCKETESRQLQWVSNMARCRLSSRSRSLQLIPDKSSHIVCSVSSFNDIL